MKTPPSSAKLMNGDRVAVVGGGPAGSFFAIRLLREARQLDLDLEVVIIEKRGPKVLNFGGYQCRGCNFCAGIISPRLDHVMEKDGLSVPDEVIQERIESVWIHGQWKNFRLRVPENERMYSVYRGTLPGKGRDNPAGFDGFLLSEAVKEGARVLHGEVEKVAYSSCGKPVLTMKLDSGERLSLESSFVSFATGINAQYGMEDHCDALIASIKELNPAFVPGRSRKTLIFELDVGESFLEHNLNREMYFIEYGSEQLVIEHTALIPKGRFLTVAMIGRCVDEAIMPQDSRRLIRDFLTLPQVERILPGISAVPLGCVCAPRMTVASASSPYGDRFAFIGDAVGSRLNKDGLYSAYMTAIKLADVVLHEGISLQTLGRGYGRTIQWLEDDNYCGKIVYALSRTAFGVPGLSRIVYQAFATEYKVRDERSRPLSRMLWKIASGTADYREVLREMFSWGVLWSIFASAAVTLRNVAIEAVLGLKWGRYGRYPTVVAVEKRETLKKVIASGLEMDLHNSPDFERMYQIKIRGSEAEIMDQLANYGLPDARFLKIRFIRMQQVKGTPNQVGSVILYKVPWTGLAAELRLTRRFHSEGLLYEADDRLVDQGRLIFNIMQARDGNRKLSIYAAFNFKKGRGVARRMLWLGVRSLFPGFVHDVAWNHALCTMKEEVERKHDHS